MAGNIALSSWSGYNHQGIICLIVGLDKLKSLFDAGEDLSKFEMGIELMNGDQAGEDFDFRKDGQLLEVHQVKAAISKTRFRQYSSAISELKAKTPSGARFLHAINKIPDWVDPGNRVKRYEYEHNRFHFGDQAFLYLIDRVGKLRSDQGVEFHKMVAQLLQADLSSRVCDEHTSKRRTKDYHLSIPLIDLKEKVDENPTLKNAQIEEIRKKMYNDFLEFIECHREFENADDDQQDAVTNLVAKIQKLPRRRFLQFLQDINPHAPSFHSITTDDYYTGPAWKDIFLNILTRVVKVPCELASEYRPEYRKEGKSFVPTLIQDDCLERIPEKILGNVKNAILGFEPDVLITKNLEGVVKIDSKPTNAPTSEPGYDPPVKNASNSVLSRKEIRFVKRDPSIKELNS